MDFYSTKKNDESFSNLKIYNFKLKELPILTKLLTLASLQGIADILSGEGITFDEFEMNFSNEKNSIKLSDEAHRLRKIEKSEDTNHEKINPKFGKLTKPARTQKRCLKKNLRIN